MMAYFEMVPNAAGENRLPSNPFKLLDLKYLVLDDGAEYTYTTADREVLAVILGGRGTFSFAEGEFSNVGGRPNVFSGKPHSVYIPCGTAGAIKAKGRLEIALVSAPSDLETAP